MPPMGKGHSGANDERRITYFATTHTRGKREMFGIRAIDRGKHMYVIGKTGMGKSTMLENMAIQDIQNGEGIAFIDPHGSTAEKLLNFVPRERINDVVYFAPFDTEYPMGFNVMEDVGYDKRHLVVSGLMGAFKRIWVDMWSARMEYILQNVLLALLEYPETTLLDVNRMLTNKPFRNAVIEKITDPVVKSFWSEEFATYTDRYTQEATPAIQNKVGQFVANPLIRHIVGQPKSTFDLRSMMDNKKIFIVNLSKGRMGESNAALLGSMLTVKIYLAAMSRADESQVRMDSLPRCYFYVDEFQSMMNEAFADILSESRKYKLALTLANQYIEQMEENVRNAVFGNVGTLITFRVGPFDAEVLKVVFEPTFEPEDLVNLGLGQIYLTLMIDGVGSVPFSADTIPPIEAPHISYREDVIQNTRRSFARTRIEVQQMIEKRHLEFAPPPVKPKESRDSRGAPFASGNNRPPAPFAERPRPRPEERRSDERRPSGSSDRQDRPRESVPGERHEPRRDQPSEVVRSSGVQPAPSVAVVREPAREVRSETTPPRTVVGANNPSRESTPQRFALQDAIKTARERGIADGRTPLEVLRERRMKKESGPHDGRQSEKRQNPEDSQRERPEVRNSPRDEEKSSAREDIPASGSSAQTTHNRSEPAPRPEISTEDLRKILHGK